MTEPMTQCPPLSKRYDRHSIAQSPRTVPTAPRAFNVHSTAELVALRVCHRGIAFLYLDT